MTQFDQEDNLHNKRSSSFENEPNDTLLPIKTKSLDDVAYQNQNKTESMDTINTFGTKSIEYGENVHNQNLTRKTINLVESPAKNNNNDNNSHFDNSGIPKILKFVNNHVDGVVKEKPFHLTLDQERSVDDNAKPLIEVLSEQKIEEAHEVVDDSIRKLTEANENGTFWNDNERISDTDGNLASDSTEPELDTNTITKCSTANSIPCHNQYDNGTIKTSRRPSTITFFCENLDTLIEYSDENDENKRIE